MDWLGSFVAGELNAIPCLVQLFSEPHVGVRKSVGSDRVSSGVFFLRRPSSRQAFRIFQSATLV